MPSQHVKTEITGKVWKIEASAGDLLEEDQPIVILESMKMEIPVPAPIRCRIVSILVSAGDTVTEGDAVAVIEI